ncbi:MULTISPECIES: copper homeostasis protein CutC [unclassified Leifsonia]|uniref:copper homeostasis protein CutC n=1 Tax=unclassified Leifsonia TaxID=2663824 RepID=UPI0007014BF5|nr:MULTISPECIES: copper homeostasis protein CutC [unclassified Leifsonia]KQX07290.1 copper homeostasis protein CutC [Leifsonia sp. Root1293]KRA11573.1 copper homeostasis protein CutC [Leifsonia sp. Root60]
MTAVEIAVQDLAGVRVALEEGADRIELCVALDLGGLTPSIGLVEAAVAAAAEARATDFVHVLVRPRGGGFVYDESELAVIERDIRAVFSAGADGVVVGAAHYDGTLDETAIARFVEAADGMTVTVHRVVDATPDPIVALRPLGALGVTRVLSSGGAADCRAGASVLERMRHAGGTVQVMAGGGVRVDDIGVLVAAGVDAVHLSARGRSDGGGASGPGGGAVGYDVTDRGLVRAAVEAVRAAPR